MNKHVLIGGGSGFIGQQLARVLRNRGFQVSIISRSPNKGQITWKDIEHKGIPPEYTSVVNLAGQNILDFTKVWSHDFKKLCWNSRVETTNLLANSIGNGATNVSTFVIMSGVGIYKPLHKVEHTEGDKIEDFDFFSKMCIELEKAGRVPSDVNCRQITVRSGVVLGRTGGMIKNLYLPFYLGLGGPVLPGYQILPWIHVLDLCKLIAYCIETPRFEGVVNGVAPQTTTNSEFASAFAKAMNRPAFFPLPEFVLKMVLQDRAVMLTTGPIVKPARALLSGFEFSFPDIQSACMEVVNPPK